MYCQQSQLPWKFINKTIVSNQGRISAGEINTKGNHITTKSNLCIQGISGRLKTADDVMLKIILIKKNKKINYLKTKYI